MRLKVFFILLNSLLYLTTSTQTYSQSLNNIKFKHFSINEGLSQITCMQMVQDDKGFIWIATQDGLNRFDGIEFKHFKNTSTRKNSLSDNYIWSMIMDKAGNLWLGTYNGGLNKFNRETETFTSYIYDEKDSTSISNNRVYSLLEDTNGNIWVGTLNGLNLFNPEKETFTRYKSEANVTTSLRHNRITSLVQDKNQNLWIGTFAGLDFLSKENINSNNIVFLHFSKDNKNSKSLSHNRIWSLYIDKKDNIWVGTRGGLNLLTNASAIKSTSKTSEVNFVRLINNKEQPNSISHNLIWSVLEDKKGNIWVGTGGGLNLLKKDKLDSPEKPFKVVLHNEKQPKSLSNNRIMSLLEDHKGNLWVGTRRGLNLLDLNKLNNPKKSFLFFHNKSEDPNSLSHNTVRSIYEDSKNNLWIGTHVGLNLLPHAKRKQSSTKFTRFLNNSNDKNSLSHNRVMSIFEDEKGNLWFGTLQGLNLLRKELINNIEKGNIISNNSFNRFYHEDKENNTFNNNVIWSIIEDNKENLWLGTEGGLNILSLKPGSRIDALKQDFIHFNKKYKDPFSLNNIVVRELFKDDKGQIWIGTDNAGLNLFKPNDQTFKSYRHNPEIANSISHDKVSHISQEKNGMWITSYGGGLNFFDPKSEEFDHYNQSQGILPTDGCSCVLSDDNGFKWVSTINGFLRFNPETNEVYRYDERDGLQGLGYNVGVCFKAKDGTMYFGGTNGLNVFHPDSITQSNYMPSVQLTNFQIFNKDVPLSSQLDKESQRNWLLTLNKNISYSDKITLPYNAYVLSFEYAALDFNIAERNIYKYKLEGFDEDWNYVGNQRKATYTNLNYGEYLLRVKGSNNDGVWSDKEVNLQIIITPPWYLTNIAKTLWLILAIGIPYYLYKRRVNMLKKQKFLLRQQVEDRTQKISQQNREISMYAEELLATNDRLNELNNFKEALTGMIVHDLKNTLNTIIGLSTDDPTKEKQKSIKQAGYQMLNMVSNILDVYKFENAQIQLNLETYTVSEISKAAYLQVQFLMEESRIKLTDNLNPKHIVKADFDLIVRVIVNLLTNAIKFTPFNGEITLLSKQITSDKIEVSVIDTGQGIAKDNLDSVFEKFGQVKAVKSGVTRSTGLGLTFCKMVLEAHNCEINVDSIPNSGTTFFFNLFKGDEKDLLTDINDHNQSISDNNNPLELTDDDKEILKSILEELKNTEIYYNSDLEKVLEKVDYKQSNGLQLWYETMQKAMFHVSEPLYNQLINIIEEAKD